MIGVRCASARARVLSSSTWRLLGGAVGEKPLARLLAPRGGHARLDRRQDLRKRRLGIAQDRHAGRVVLSELPRIDVKVDHFEAGRHRIDVEGQRQGQEIPAHREQHVCVQEELPDGRRHPGERPSEQGVRRRERRGVRHALGVDGRAKGLGHLDELGVGVALGDRVPGEDQGAFRPRQRLGGRFHCLPVSANPRGHARGRPQLDGALGLEDVRRQRQEDRAGRGRQRGLRRTANEPRQVLEPAHLGRPLDERTRNRWKVGPEDRLGDVEALVVLTRRHEKRRARLLGIVEHPESVPETRSHVDADDPELPGGLGVPVGHRDDGGLLEPQHVGQRGLLDKAVHERELGRPGIAEQVLDALLLENLQEGALPRRERHGDPPEREWWCRPTAARG